MSPSNNDQKSASTKDNTPVPEVSPQKAIRNSLEPPEEVPVQKNYTEVMMQRWLNNNQASLPPVDFKDSTEYLLQPQEVLKNQAEPEYAHLNY